MKNLNEMKIKNKMLKEMMQNMAEITDSKSLKTKLELIKLDEKIDLIALSKKVTDEQLEQLINILKQFTKCIDDFVEENKIELEK